MNMFCPRCGKQFDVATSFCRTCGLAREDVSEIVGSDAENLPETITKPNYNMISVGIGLFTLGTVLGLANIVVRDLKLFPEIYGKAVFLAFVIAGLLSMGLSFLFPKKVHKKRKRVNTDADEANALNTAPLHAQLQPANVIDAAISFARDSREPADAETTSVTKNTTRQLG